MSAELTLHEALRRIAASRDADAWDAVLDRTGPAILRTTRRILHDDALAEDACQETLLQIRAHAGAFVPPRSAPDAELAARVWIMRIATHVSLHMARGRRRSIDRETFRAEFAPTTDSSTPEVRALADEEARLLYREIEELPDAWREPLMLRYFADLDYAEVATALTCSHDAAKMRVQRGLQRLRARLAALGVAATLVELTAHLSGSSTAHAASLSVAQKAAWTALLKSPAAPALSIPITAAAATFAAKFALTAAALILAATGITAFLYFKPATPQPAPSTAAAPANVPLAPKDKDTPAPAPAKPAPSKLITPRSADAWRAFVEMPDLRVVRIGDHAILPPYSGLPRQLDTPVRLRFKPIEGREFVTQIAAANNLKLAWFRDDAIAVLYPGAPDADIQHASDDFASADAVVRQTAIWRAGKLDDIRVIPLLLKAVKDPDAEVARLGHVGLRRVGWGVVLATGGDVVDLIAADMNSRDRYLRGDTTAALSFVADDRKWPLLEKAVASEDSQLIEHAGYALAALRGERALALLEKALTGNDLRGRWIGYGALKHWIGRTAVESQPGTPEENARFARTQLVTAVARSGIPAARTRLEEFLRDTDADVRTAAARELGTFGDEPSRTWLRQALTSTDAATRCGAIQALGGTLEEAEALPWLEKALVDPDVKFRNAAVVALADLGGEKAPPLLEKAGEDADQNVRRHAIQALGNIGGDAAAKSLEKILPGTEKDLRFYAIQALRNVGTEHAIELLEKESQAKSDGASRSAIHELAELSHPKSLALLEDFISHLPEGSMGGPWNNLHDNFDIPSLAPTIEKWASSKHATVREVAAEWAHRLPLDSAMAILEKTARDPNNEVRKAAYRSLTVVDGPRALRLLEDGLEERDWEALYNVRAAFESIGGGEALKVLQRVAAHGSAKARDAAALALRGQPPELAMPLLEPLLKDPNKDVRSSAAHTMGDLGGEAVLARLFASSDAKVREGATNSLLDESRKELPALVDRALADPNAQIRINALFRIVQLRGERAFPAIETALADPHKVVRASAVEALLNFRRHQREVFTPPSIEAEQRALALMEKALGDKETFVRVRAIEILGYFEDERALRALEKTMGDPDEKIRSEVTKAIGNIGRPDALPLLQKAFVDASPLVRTEAASGLGRIGGSKKISSGSVHATLLSALKTEQDRDVQDRIVSALKAHFPTTPGTAEALQTMPNLPRKPNPASPTKPPKPPADDGKF